MTNEVPKFKVIVSTEKGKKAFSFESKEIIIGRSKNSTLKVPLEGMSRAHFSIRPVNDNFFITDLGSSNGTVVNGERLVKDTPKAFNEGDMINIPGLDINFEIYFTEKKEKTEKTLIGFLFSGKGSDVTDATTQVKLEKVKRPKKKKSEIEFKYEEDQELIDRERSKKMQEELEDEEKNVDIEFDIDISKIDIDPSPKK